MNRDFRKAVFAVLAVFVIGVIAVGVRIVQLIEALP